MIKTQRNKLGNSAKTAAQNRSSAALNALPDAAPLAIQELFDLIDCRTQSRYLELSEILTSKLRAEISKSRLSYSQIAAMSKVKEADLSLICQRRIVPDLDRLERICHSLGGRLCLTIIDRNYVELDCSNHLQSALQLEIFLSSNLHKLEIHSLATALFKKCGLRRAQGLHGGALERRAPFLYRLMRISAFMRCTLRLTIEFIYTEIAAS